MTLAIPEAAALQGAVGIRIRMSNDLVALFAALTGDRSGLHVDDSFARRSAYRRPVVHGLLPVGFLALAPAFRLDGFHCTITAIKGRFNTPAFADDTLVLTLGPGNIKGGGSEAEFTYQIENDFSHATVTSGTVTVAYEPRVVSRAGGVAPRDGGMLLRPVEQKNYLIEEIEPGTTDDIDFEINTATLRDFYSLLARGAGGSEPAAAIDERFHVPNLLALMLYSTSLGISLPGASATFLEFAASFERPLALNTPYRLHGNVTHRSKSTRIVKKELLITAPDRPDVFLRGKAATLVTPPRPQMPSVSELREAADWGLKDKVVIITGASRGIGETTAKMFALFGARVVVNYHRGADDARRVVEEIVGAGGEAMAVGADVTSADEVRALVQQAHERYGAVDILVNNAARDYRPIPFMKLSWEDIQNDLDVIVKGAFLCCQQVLPLMLQQGGGKIINISTVTTDDPPPDQTKYVVAKSALVGLTRSLSVEFAARNIQVNMVVPNLVETDLVAHIPEGFRKKIAHDIPMGRPTSPIDVARAVVFLASSFSSFTTGQKLMVTGGGAPYA